MLPLFSRCMRAQAIAAFGGKRRDYCDAQFIATPQGLLCFFEAPHAELRSPDSLQWTPARDYKVNAWTFHGPPTWLPPTQDGLYYILLRPKGDEQYVFVGAASLSVDARGPGENWALFRLREKLPIAEWALFGGSLGWTIRGDVSGRLDPDQIAEFDSLLITAREGASFSVTLSRYAGDTFRFITNGRRAVLDYEHRLSLGELGADEPPEAFYQDAQGGWPVAARNTLPIDVALEATRTYFSTGVLPSNVQWDTPGDDWLFANIETSLRYLFGHSRPDALALITEYDRRRTEWQKTYGATYHDDEMLGHEGPEGAAYIIQWMIGLGHESLSSEEFLDWRRSVEARRRAESRSRD